MQSDLPVKSAILLTLLLAALPSTALGQEWIGSVASGPFVFGDFAERKATIDLGDDSVDVTTTLSADTRPGLMLDVERLLNDRFAIRLEGTATRAPMSAKTLSDDDDPSGDGVTIEIGDLDVLSIAAAAVFRFNRGGSLRPYLLGGPAWVTYKMDDEDKTGVEPLFDGRRSRIGALVGAGVEWWWRPRLAIRAELADIYTESPLERSDFRGTPSSKLQIDNTHNVHTNIGLRYRF